MSTYLKVQGHTALVRDTSSNAVINTSEVDYKKYIAQKEALKLKRSEFEKQTQEINNLKNDLAEIKSLLQKILEK